MRARRQEEVEKQLEMAGRAAGVSRLELMRQRLEAALKQVGRPKTPPQLDLFASLECSRSVVADNGGDARGAEDLFAAALQADGAAVRRHCRNRSEAYAQLGDRGGAVKALEKLVARGEVWRGAGSTEPSPRLCLFVVGGGEQLIARGDRVGTRHEAHRLVGGGPNAESPHRQSTRQSSFRFFVFSRVHILISFSFFFSRCLAWLRFWRDVLRGWWRMRVGRIRMGVVS